jgi:hypothetical protein
MSGMEAMRRNASAFRFKHSKSLINLSTPTKAGECSFDDPPPRQDLETLRHIGTLDDFRHQQGKAFFCASQKMGP